MIYSHTIQVSKTLTFEPQYYNCRSCGKKLEKHIICEGARFHVLHWDNRGTYCSCKQCEINHHCGGTK